MSVHEMSISGSPELKNILKRLIRPVKTFVTAIDSELNSSGTNQTNNLNGVDMSQVSGLMGNLKDSRVPIPKMPKFKKRGGFSKKTRKFSKTLKKLRFKKLFDDRALSILKRNLLF